MSIEKSIKIILMILVGILTIISFNYVNQIELNNIKNQHPNYYVFGDTFNSSIKYQGMVEWTSPRSNIILVLGVMVIGLIYSREKKVYGENKT